MLGSLVGQLTAGITLAVAVIYGAGALTFALRLYYTHLPWESVVGQLPHDLIITTGFGQIVLIATIIGILGAVFLNFLVNEARQDTGPAYWARLKVQRYLLAEPSVSHSFKWLALASTIGIAEALICLPRYLYYEHRYLHPDVVISPTRASIAVATVSAIGAGVALILLPSPPKDRVLCESVLSGSSERKQKRAAKSQIWKEGSNVSLRVWRVWVGALVGFASIPGIAAFSAASLFPDSFVCSSTFVGGHLSGNLIGTNGNWAYMIEYRSTNFSHDYFAIVPLSSIQLQTIGRYEDCNTVKMTPTSATTGSP